jgi:hypothetical protein
MEGMKWPQSKLAQGMIALLGGILVAFLMACLSVILSAMFFDWKYPHDGQSAPVAFLLGVFSFPVWLVLAIVPFYFVQRHWKNKTSAENSN